MCSRKKELSIGVLGMPDNDTTRSLIQFLSNNNVSIKFVIYWTPSIRGQYARVMRKLTAGGVIATARRIYYALFKGITERQKQHRTNFKQYFVSSHNSSECSAILEDERVDILILTTDAIVTNRILKRPSLVTLNAHPGWIPQFRGLGSTAFQLAEGKFPAASVHKVDEGIDTGPLVLREYIEVQPASGLDFIEEQVRTLQNALLLKAIEMFKSGNVEYIDTFEEPSNMTKGMPLKQRKALNTSLKSGKIKLGVDRYFNRPFVHYKTGYYLDRYFNRRNVEYIDG